MQIHPWSAPGGIPGVGDAALDALLERDPLPEGAAAGLRPLAEVIAALNATPLTGELAAQAGALALFRGEIGMSGEPSPSRHRRRPLLTSLLSAKLATAAAAATVALGGAAAAAYAGALPASMQKVAHDTIGAPQASPSAPATPTATPVGPNATGHAAYGLCTAYEHMKAHGSAKQKAVAFRNLAAAAGGAANVTAYCAGVAHPGSSPSGQPTSHPSGNPSAMPSQAQASHPASHPSATPTPTQAKASHSHPSGRPTTHS